MKMYILVYALKQFPKLIKWLIMQLQTRTSGDGLRVVTASSNTKTKRNKEQQKYAYKHGEKLFRDVMCVCYVCFMFSF